MSKLTIELIPATCFYSNVRSTLKPKEWDVIRFISYANADNKCEICGGTGLEQGFRHPIECHEIWEYDEKKKIQKLIGLISLCPLCHSTKHFGRASAMGKQSEAFKQLETVNKWSHKEAVQHVAEEFEKYKERSKHQWTLDISILKQPPYNLTIATIVTRKFKKKPWRKKRRTKKK